MRLRTELEPGFTFPLQRKEGLFFCGSCFSLNIGTRLQRLKWPTFINSHGILFNPLAVAQALQDLLNKKVYGQEDLIAHRGLHSSLNHHSAFSQPEARHCLEQINDSLRKGTKALQSSQAVFITLGSAHAYWHIEQQTFVANCHKLPGQTFRKELLSIEQITSAIGQMVKRVSAEYPGIKWIFSLSPVRHEKDGLVENARSKAILLSSIHELTDKFEHCHYFPAYELMMDDLRDYRFYSSDLLHPNEQAVEYIWDFFQQSFIGSKEQENLNRIEKLMKRCEHRLLFPASDEAHKFRSVLIADLQQAEQDLGVSFSQELNALKA